jgi:hypothetical protein
MNEHELKPATKDELMLTADQVSAIASQLFAPLMQLVAHNTQALEQVGAALTANASRLEELERHQRLQTPVSQMQVRYINEAIKKKACAILGKRTLPEELTVGIYLKKLVNVMRRDILIRYGVASLREIPKCEYSVVLSQIDMWADVIVVQRIITENRANPDNAP